MAKSVSCREPTPPGGAPKCFNRLNRIFHRTDKGVAELAQRSKAIPARARTVLLLVDGRATGEELLSKVGFENRDELFELLLREGYIEAEPEPEPGTGTPTASRTRTGPGR